MLFVVDVDVDMPSPSVNN